MLSQWSLQDAKNKFSAIVEAATKGTPQFVSKRGKAAVVVISAEKYEKMILQERASAPDFAHFLLSMPSCDDTEEEGRDEEKGLCLREVDF